MNNNDITHDPREFAKGLQQILISDTKKIGFLFGAGTSFATKSGSNSNSRVPAVAKMTQLIVDKLKAKKDAFKNALEQLEEEFEQAVIDFNIEQILSNLIQKEHVIGKGTLNGLRRTDFEKMRALIENGIIELVAVHKKKDSFIKDLIHSDFAQWIGQADRKFPIEIFTTNYDYLLELGLETHDIPYFDGFIGSFEPFFIPIFVEDLTFLPNVTKLWKIHGSLGWDIDAASKKIIRKYQDESKIIVFPSLQKYDESKKQPYVSYLDRLSKFIKQDDSVLFVCGYSLGDQHINDVILNALASSKSSHVIALLYDKYWDNDRKPKFSLISDSSVAKLGMSQPKLSIYGMRSAVIGGRIGEWKLKSEPGRDDSIIVDKYFDEDAPEDLDVEKNVEFTGGMKWTGKGEFRLPDFEQFVSFLSYLNYENYLRSNIKDEII